MALCALAFGLTMCGSAKKKKSSDPPTEEAGAAGESGAIATAGGETGGGSGQSGGSGPGGRFGTGGIANAGAAGEPPIAGTGGTGGDGGTSGNAGKAGESGEGGSGGEGGSCEPDPTCGPDQATCESGWDANCPSGFTECCDPELGVYKTCDTDIGRTETLESVFINSCTDESFGAGPCGACLNVGDPDCDSDWQSGGCIVKKFCSDAVLGYRMSCEELDQYTFRTHVECLCNP